ETADERSWRTLPAQIAIARARMPSGEHAIGFGASPGGQDLRLRVAGRYAVIALRFLGGTTFAALPPPAKIAPPVAEVRTSQGTSTSGAPGTF
ncbi:MAG: hypothetical protein ABI619_12980, partial [Betaproteobacteria bacterium]